MNDLINQPGTSSGSIGMPKLGEMNQIGTVLEVKSGTVKVLVPKEVIARQELAKHCRIGAIIKCYSDGAEVFGIIRYVAAGTELGTIVLELELSGQMEASGFARGVSNFPLPGEACFAASPTDLERIFAPGDGQSVVIGKVFPTDYIDAGLRVEPLLSKHFAVLGSTGSGKSSTVALMIHRFVEAMPNAHILVLDPHNEYERAFESSGVHFNTANLALPYWLMNFTEHVEVFVGHDTKGRGGEVDILKRVLLRARKSYYSGPKGIRITVDTPIPYKLSDMLSILDDESGKLDKAEDIYPFLKLRTKIEELRNDPRYSFMFSGLLINDNMSEIVSKILRFPVLGRPVTTLDLSGVPSEIVDVVVSVLSRMVFDYAVWSRQMGEGTPLLLICEEAHRYVPRKVAEGTLYAARKSLERIAKEGRKYGVSLGLVTQRPSDLSGTVLSQCGTLISMRLNNEYDRGFVANAMPEGSGSFLDSLPTLKNRECVISGEGVGAPVRVRLDFLEEKLRPASDDPEFHTGWKHDLSNGNIVDSVIAEWRKGEK